MEPTTEQQAALDLFKAGIGLAIEAGAGTGKTSTLKMLAESTRRRGQYMAFNKAIVEEAKRKMPDNVNASTVHSLAFRSKGAQFRDRLNEGRMPSWKLAQCLRLDPLVVQFGGKPKVLQPAWLGSMTMRAITNFCQSADKEPKGHHVPYAPGIDESIGSSRGFQNNAALRDHLRPVLAKAWADLQNPNGELPFSHAVYLKLYELDSPRIPADFVLLDEGQDASPVIESIFNQQEHAQRIVVGDANQAIYGFTGAVDALSHFKDSGAAYATLSKSFRFGQPIADVANVILDELDADLRMTGFEAITSTIAPVPDEEIDAYLCRSNAGAVTRLLQLQAIGRPVHLLGGGKEVLSFARAAKQLQDGASTSHPDLACFDNWLSVREYVEQDPQGDELRLLVRLVDEFGVDTIIKAVDGQAPERGATIISTAHKSKGCEWSRVRLNDDYGQSTAAEELRLLYVAATRAQHVLDVTMCGPLNALLAGKQQVLTSTTQGDGA